MQKPAHNSNRRAWLRDTARLAVLGALGGGAALLSRRDVPRRADGCRHAMACSGCPSFNHCTLPERLPAATEER
jgi:hypothetical protein